MGGGLQRAVVVADDDEDGGAASVGGRAVATAVLGVGEEDGEVRRGVGVRMVASGLLRGVGDRRDEGGGAPWAPTRLGIVSDGT